MQTRQERNRVTESPVAPHIESALDYAFEQHVAGLFNHLCGGIGEEMADPGLTRQPGKLAIDRFARGLEIATTAHAAAIERIAGPVEDEPTDAEHHPDEAA